MRNKVVLFLFHINVKGVSRDRFYRYQELVEEGGVEALVNRSRRVPERFHKTILQEFYQVTFRKHLYGDLEKLQAERDIWLWHYTNQRTHQGKKCCGLTPMDTLIDGKKIWTEKNLNRT